jgi:hypothetical protein
MNHRFVLTMVHGASCSFGDRFIMVLIRFDLRCCMLHALYLRQSCFGFLSQSASGARVSYFI